MNNTKVYGDIPNFDEDDDIILPNSIIGEIYYIWCITSDMLKTRKNLDKKWMLLKRQIYFFIKWLKVKNN